MTLDSLKTLLLPIRKTFHHLPESSILGVTQFYLNFFGLIALYLNETTELAHEVSVENMAVAEKAALIFVKNRRYMEIIAFPMVGANCANTKDARGQCKVVDCAKDMEVVPDVLLMDVTNQVKVEVSARHMAGAADVKQWTVTGGPSAAVFVPPMVVLKCVPP